MKGWLAIREGFLLSTHRFFFRLQWGFLTKHLTETSAAIAQYFVHAAEITIHHSRRRIIVHMGPLGIAFTRHPTVPTVRRLVLIADDIVSIHTWATCLLRARHRDIRAWYTLGDPLGEGADGVVFRAISHIHRRHVAVKRVAFTNPRNTDKAAIRLRRLLKEIQLQHKVAKRTRYVPDVVDVFYDAQFCYIAMELANQGSLSNMLDKRQGPLDEELMRNVAVQLGRCLLAVHQCGVVHRDIKCDNVLLQRSSTKQTQVQLCDFGFAAVWRPENGHSMDEFCRMFLGTESYLAPELIRDVRYGAPADMFAFGVVIHVCLTGEFPFPDDKQEALQWMQSGELDSLDRAPVSAEAKSFCRGLLNIDAERRLTAVGLLQHRWLRGPPVAFARRPASQVGSMRIVARRAFFVVLSVVVLRRKAWLSRRADRRRENVHESDTGDRIPWLCGATDQIQRRLA